MLLQLCPDLTESQLARLVCMFQDSSSGFIAYDAFLSRFTSQPAVYRRGNNLGQLLAHRPSIYSDTVINPQPPEMINASPTYGLPGVKAILQKQVASYYFAIQVAKHGWCTSYNTMINFLHHKSSRVLPELECNVMICEAHQLALLMCTPNFSHLSLAAAHYTPTDIKWLFRWSTILLCHLECFF